MTPDTESSTDRAAKPEAAPTELPAMDAPLTPSLDDAAEEIAATSTATTEATDPGAATTSASTDGAPQPPAAAATEATDATAEGDTTPEGGAAPQPVRKIREPNVVVAPDVGAFPDDIGLEDFAAAVERTVVEFSEGDLVEGVVVRIDPDEVLVDIGYKSEGVIPLKELSIRKDVDPHEVATEGERIEALVLQKEDQDGRLILSKKRAQYERAWGRVEAVMNEGGTVTGRVIEVVKGGLIVDIGLRGFLPASLVDLRRVRDLQPFIGEDLEAKVIELDKNRNNVVLSRRAHLEEAQAEQRHAFLDDLAPGEVRPGVVSSVVNFGAFVDLGGMDGLVHVSELSWEHVSHPSEAVSVGDEVQVKVLEVDRERERISLSVRQTRDDPWQAFSDHNELGAVVDGKVTKTVPFGAFVSVNEGVEGLVHVSEIASHHVESPELELSVGQAVKVKITEIDVDRRRVSLSIKQASPDWQERPVGPAPERKRKVLEFEREDAEESPEPSFSADASLEAILQELKEKGIGKK
jgi:small subunit ribosomal protein S1